MIMTNAFLSSLEQSQVSTPPPQDFKAHYELLLRSIPENQQVKLEQVPLCSDVAKYYNLSYRSNDGTTISARYIHPKSEQNVPLILAFHDFTRSVRGWHHLTRYTALGFAVIAMQCRYPLIDVTAGAEKGCNHLQFMQYYADALATAKAALSLSRIDTDNIILCGDGLGGALAACVAAMFPQNVTKCTILNPLPCDFRRVWQSDFDTGFYQGVRNYFRNFDAEHSMADQFFDTLSYIDCVNFALLLKCQLLLGTSIMDKTAPAATQFSFYNAVTAPKKHIIFPKHEHELINFYENEQLKFLISGTIIS